MQSEFVQDVFEEWQKKAVQGQAEERYTTFEVWFVDHGRLRLQCHQPRRVRLYEAYEQWELSIKHAWHELLVPMETHELHLVQPSPPDMDQETAGHILIIQNPRDELVTNLMTTYSHGEARSLTGPIHQIAGTTHEHIYMEHIIEGLGYRQQCLSDEPTHHCEVWYHPHRMLPGRPWPGRSGMGLIIHLRPVTLQGPVLLQLSTTIVHTRERQTHGQVAQTHGPRDEAQVETELTPPTAPEHLLSFGYNATELIDGDGHGLLPQFLEVRGELTAVNVQAELKSWGHHVHAYDCHPHNKFFCINSGLSTSHDSALHEDWRHYLFCHEDVTDPNGSFAHTVIEPMTEIQMLRFLCQLGYSRAVILQQTLIDENWTKILFSHQEPVPEKVTQLGRPRTPWPDRPTVVPAEHEQIIRLDGIENLSTRCALCTDFDRQDLRDFFLSAEHILCTEFHFAGLPDEIAAEINTAPEEVIDLDSYDRLLIYTDGSSRPEGRRMTPQRADEIG